MPNGRFKRGDSVRVLAEDRPGHVRTPYYVRGKTGRIEKVHGEFLNPETLAYGQDGKPKRPLYLVAFDQTEVWKQYEAAPQDKVCVDIYEHWLEPV